MDYAWLVMTSPRGVSAIIAAREGRALPAALRTAAVGESTAAALRNAGARSVLVGRGGGVHGLIPALLSADSWRGLRVLAPRSAQGERDLAKALRAWGAEVDEVVAYRTLPRPADEIARSWRRGRPDAAVITSPSAALALAGALGLPALRGLDLVVAIGPTTAATLARLGIAAEVSELADFTAVAARTGRALEAMAARHTIDPARVGTGKEI
jgi:uroporphyrinogen-III synthase